MSFVRWFNDMLKLAAVAAVLAGASMAIAPFSAGAQENFKNITPPVDRSRGYFGGATPRFVEPPSGRQMVDIAEVGGGVNIDAILGCSGLDIGAAISQTLEIGNLADEFTNYLKTSLAQSALTLLYQSPSLNAVLDGLRAVGHARVSMGQAQCSATEAFVNSRSQEVRQEALDLCLAENNNSPSCSQPEMLRRYIENLLGVDEDGNRAEGPGGRWSGCLYDQICESGENCAWSGFVPNFCYDVGAGEGKTSEPMMSPQEAFDSAETEADKIIDERMEKACEVVNEEGYTEALRELENVAGGTSADGAAASGGEEANPAMEGYSDYFGSNSCVDPETGAVYADVKRLLDQASTSVENEDGTTSNAVTGGAGLDFSGMQKIIAGTVKCNLGKKIHPHVDAKMCLLPAAQQQAMKKSISQAVAAESTISVFNAIIFKLSELLATKGFSSDGGMNSAVRDQVVMLIDQVKNMRDAMRSTLDSYKDVSTRVAAMNDYVEATKDKNRDIYDNRSNTNLDRFMRQ